MPAPQRLTDHASVDVEVQRAASGGFGIVYMGPDRLNDGRWSALKTLKPEVLATSPRVRDLFIREALTWCGLWLHANLLTAQTVTEMNGQPFLLLEYAQHGNLRDLLRRRPGPLPLNAALAPAQMIAAGLVALHTPNTKLLRPEPLVHRDLKPENVLIDEAYYAKITDFGLAKAVESDSAALALLEALQPETGRTAASRGAAPTARTAAERATRSQAVHTAAGQALGTPAYMAPDQWQDAATAGPPADMYAFGLILSELTAGRHALLDLEAGHSREAWRRAHLSGHPRRLRERAPAVPESVEILYQALLAKRPEARPTAGEALRVLQESAAALGQEPYVVPEVFTYTSERETVFWHNWAIAHIRFKLYPEALERNSRALALAPHDPEVLITQGNILVGQGQMEAALSAYDAALAELPAEDRLHRALISSQRGNLLSRAKHYAEAEAVYLEALALLPNYPVAWNNRADNERLWGQADAQAGRVGEARAHVTRGLAHIERAIALAPDHPRYHDLQAALRELLARPGG